jgi:RNA polymerase sigma factor (sigma-70 family)
VRGGSALNQLSPVESSGAAELRLELARIATGERTALAALYRATSAKLFGVCLRILKDRGESEDVLQDVYLTVWRRAGSFDPARGISPISWLAVIARNKAIDRLRARGPLAASQPIEGLEVSDPTPSAASALETSEELRRLMSCLETLEDRPRAAIRTAFFDGVTYEALAQRMEVPIGTLKSWVRRGLLKLRDCLQP